MIGVGVKIFGNNKVVEKFFAKLIKKLVMPFETNNIYTLKH